MATPSANTRGRAPADFIWGTATAAYQIEGSINVDGRGASVWDTFSHTPGKILDGTNGDIACDHYQRWRDDVALMARLGLSGYRFSVSWSRVQPMGAGAVNKFGLDFYEKLIDALLENHITPFVTLYHWDLPQALQDNGGGWLNRDTASRFADYAEIVTRRLGDRVKHWITLNEPFIQMYYGYVTGEHAPGLTDVRNALPVMHHMLLGHGLALQPIRSNVADAQIGIAYSLAKVEPVTDHDADITIADHADAFINRIMLDPVLRGVYPDAISHLIPDGLVQENDLRTISAPTEMIGVNYYLRLLVRADSKAPLGYSIVPPASKDLTAMGWEVYPEGLDYWLHRVAKDYPDHNVYITENGTAFPDEIGADDQVHDPRRLEYLRDHTRVALAALADGVPLKGYFLWSLMDNFEWAMGFMPRFGIIYTDYVTQRRVIKDSGHWYGRLAAIGDPDEA